MPTLREIEADLLALEQLLCEVGGDVSDEDANATIDQWLAELGAAEAKKLDGYATLIAHLSDRADARDREAKRLTVLVKVDQSAVKRLKDRLRWHMETKGEQRIDTEFHRISLANNGGKRAVTITDDLGIPDEYIDYQTVRVIDMERIRSELEAGLDLPFARLEERGKHVRIT